MNLLNLKSYLSVKEKFLRFHNLIKTKKFPDFSLFKTYPLIWKKIYFKDFPRLPQLLLPAPNKPKNISLFDIIRKRRSIRNFSKDNLSLNEISNLLYFSAGINYFGSTRDETKRMYPSAGARYPLEIYPILFSQQADTSAGIYHYNVKKHGLELLLEKNIEKEIKLALGDMNAPLITTGSVLFAVTAVFGRTYIKYGESSYKLILLEAGHMAQNMYLVAEALGLGCCSIGSSLDDKINKLLDVEPRKEELLYLLVVGKKSNNVQTPPKQVNSPL